jgi:ubiquinone/menaquinone biosynthesis C-methylase UbiE
LEWTDSERKAQAVFGRRASSYVYSPTHSNRLLLRRLVALAEVDGRTRVLDVATGTGHTTFAFAPFVRHVTAVDITPEMIDEARRLRAQNGLGNVEFALATATRLPFVDEAFDVVACRRSGHHFADIAAALREMNRVLTTGGRLVIDDRSVPEDDSVDAMMNRLDALHDESHVREYRSSEWIAMLEEARFDMKSVWTYSEHRPLTSLTADVAPERVAQIHAIIEGLTEDQRLAMNVAEKDGQVFSDHWFVMLAAEKAWWSNDGGL